MFSCLIETEKEINPCFRWGRCQIEKDLLSNPPASSGTVFLKVDMSVKLSPSKCSFKHVFPLLNCFLSVMTSFQHTNVVRAVDNGCWCHSASPLWARGGLVHPATDFWITCALCFAWSHWNRADVDCSLNPGLPNEYTTLLLLCVLCLHSRYKCSHVACHTASATQKPGDFTACFAAWLSSTVCLFVRTEPLRSLRLWRCHQRLKPCGRHSANWL